MLKETSLCMGCMNEKEGQDPCRLCGYSDLDPHIPAYLEPKTFLNERYIVGRLLSYNGEGAVYIGYDTVTSSKVTIKEFMPDTLCARQRGETNILVNANNSPLYKTYLSEFADLNRSLMKLRGMAHIQAVLDVFYANNTCYAVFEFINGISLKTYLANAANGMAWEQVKELFPPIFTTLSLAHAAGIIHRGISAQTIFVTDKMELLLSGFAITAARTTGTEIACEIYSGYAAPEQYSNEPNGTWTDVYGISAVLYKVLTGTTPPEAIARTNGMLEPSLININIPQNVSKVIMGGMKLNTDSRIRTVTEFVDKLFAPPSYSTGGSSADDYGRPVSRREEKRIKKQKKERIKFLSLLIGVGMVLITFAVVFALTLSGACVPGSGSISGLEVSGSGDKNDSSPGMAASDTQSGGTPPAGTGSGTPGISEPQPVGSESYGIPDFTDHIRYDNAVRTWEGILTLTPEYEYTDDLEAGYIFDQSVDPGTIVPRGTEVNVKVSRGMRKVNLPDYENKTAERYIEELKALGIKNESFEEHDNGIPVGTVMYCTLNGERIMPGTSVNVESGDTVRVYIAKRDVVEMPDLTDGYYYESAVEQFGDNLVLSPEYEYNDKFAEGRIFDQSVKAGDKIDKGSAVNVKVSLGSGIVSLPAYGATTAWETYKEELDALGIKYTLLGEKNPGDFEGHVLRCTKGFIDIGGGDPISIRSGESIFVYVVRN